MIVALGIAATISKLIKVTLYEFLSCSSLHVTARALRSYPAKTTKYFSSPYGSAKHHTITSKKKILTAIQAYSLIENSKIFSYFSLVSFAHLWTKLTKDAKYKLRSNTCVHSGANDFTVLCSFGTKNVIVTRIKMTLGNSQCGLARFEEINK